MDDFSFFKIKKKFKIQTYYFNKCINFLQFNSFHIKLFMWKPKIDFRNSNTIKKWYFSKNNLDKPQKILTKVHEKVVA